MKDKKNYQLVVVIQPELAKKDKDKLLTALEAELTGAGFKVGNKTDLGTKQLAYTIEKHDQGDFLEYSISSQEEKVDINDVNLFINREENIIRYLFLKE